MADTHYIPIEQKAKGRSNLFKFVSLRSPDTVSRREYDLYTIVHPNLDASKLLKMVDNPDEFTKYDILYKNAIGFEAIKKISSFDSKYKDLIALADWLGRNWGPINPDELPVNPDALSPEALVNVWDNYFYQIVLGESKELREGFARVLVANNFVAKLNWGLKNEELARLAKSIVVVPRAVFSKPSKEITLQSLREKVATLQYNPIDADAIELKVSQYKRAISELLEVNDSFLIKLSEFDRSTLPSGPTPPANADTTPQQLTKAELIDAVGNPLTHEHLTGKVSEETLLIARELKLSELRDPVKAVQKIDDELRKTGAALLSGKKFSQKVVVAGGGVYSRNAESGFQTQFNEGCFPTIVDQVNVYVNPNLKQISCTGGPVGNCGAASQNNIVTTGALSFEVLKIPNRGTSMYIGLSVTNANAAAGSIKYAIFLTSSTVNGQTQGLAFPMKNGSILNSPLEFANGDSFRISRTINQNGQYLITFERLRPSTGAITQFYSIALTGADITEPLIMDLAYGDTSHSISNVRMTPCDGDGGNGNGDGDGTGGTDEGCSGLTNLGVGDYMRVEQEVCCYTVGEVAHIENIMQGEYKERSTRMLRREETTFTYENETTTEKLRDTTTTDRYEMEKETSQVQQQDSSFDLGVNMTAQYGPIRLTVDTGFATSSSSTESNSQAVTYAREVSNRALDRVVSRVREEQIRKVIEEFEENNKHGLDNRNNPNGHVTGIYRWVDKIYKNQVVNYGIRMMIEFMIPEPAKFFLWAKSTQDLLPNMDMPKDPRENGLASHSLLTEYNYATWIAQYGVEVEPPPALTKTVSKAYHLTKDDGLDTSVFAKSWNDLQVPDGYKGSSADVWMYWIYRDNGDYKMEVTVGDNSEQLPPYNFDTFALGNIEGIIPVSVAGDEIYVLKLNIVANCVRKDQLLEAWKIDTFKKILEAYENKKAEYENALAQIKAQSSMGIQITGNNPLFNRTTEQQELKKGCLDWMEASYGQNYYGQTTPCATSENMPVIDIKGDLGCYSQKAKFFEQAFDWEIMSYLFYPYFWGKKCSWKELYRLDDNDPIFRSFLQAGMARVVVPVKPNYERAVLYYLDTKEVWNGGEPPLPNDPLYVPIIHALANQEPTPVGDPWETRLPTSLNIIQHSSSSAIGDGLPCNCENYDADATGDSVLTGSEDSTNE